MTHRPAKISPAALTLLPSPCTCEFYSPFILRAAQLATGAAVKHHGHRDQAGRWRSRPGPANGRQAGPQQPSDPATGRRAERQSRRSAASGLLSLLRPDRQHPVQRLQHICLHANGQHHLRRAGRLAPEHQAVRVGALALLYRLLRAGLALLQPPERAAGPQAPRHADALLPAADAVHHRRRRHRAGRRHQRLCAAARRHRRALERAGAHRAAELPVGRPDRQQPHPRPRRGADRRGHEPAVRSDERHPAAGSADGECEAQSTPHGFRSHARGRHCRRLDLQGDERRGVRAVGGCWHQVGHHCRLAAVEGKEAVRNLEVRSFVQKYLGEEE